MKINSCAEPTQKPLVAKATRTRIRVSRPPAMASCLLRLAKCCWRQQLSEREAVELVDQGVQLVARADSFHGLPLGNAHLHAYCVAADRHQFDVAFQHGDFQGVRGAEEF